MRGDATYGDIGDDAYLKTIVERWPDLPDSVKAYIMAIIGKEAANN